MQNEFEKQVQKKMEELSLLPSAPVWERIEKEIREKKHKRRLIIWLPLFAGIAILAGYITVNTIISEQSSKPSPSANFLNPEAKSQPLPQQSKSLSGNTTQKENVGSSPDAQSQNVINSNRSTPERAQKELKDSYITDANSLQTNRKVSRKPSGGNIKSKSKVFSSDPSSSQNRGNLSSKNSGVDDDDSPSHPTGKPSANALQHLDTNATINSGNSPTSTKLDSVTKELSDSAVLHQAVDSVLKTEPRKPVVVKKRKWRFGLEAALGFSSVPRGFGSGGNKSLLYASAPTFSQYPPLLEANSGRSTREGLSFAVGFIAERNLTKKLSLTTGIGYMYNSYRSYVGTLIMPASTTIVTGAAPQQFSQTFYTNRPNSGNEYVNGFHFLSVPIGVAYRPFNSFPLFINAGVTVQRLVASDALVYNSSSNIYYTDEAVFKKTQLSSNFGLGYHFSVKKIEMVAGPEIGFGLSPIDHIENKHFFSAGIRTKFLLRK